MEPEERPRGNIPFKLYLSYFRAGANCIVLLGLFFLCVTAQVKQPPTGDKVVKVRSRFSDIWAMLAAMTHPSRVRNLDIKAEGFF